MSDRGYRPLDPCVHCGLCLQACPTFVATADEADSPRGRIVLMNALADAPAAASPVATYHLDRCLGCRACETACPSGVSYGHALETARADLAAHRSLDPRARMVLFAMEEARVRIPLLRVARAARSLISPFAGRSPLAFALASLAATRPTLALPAVAVRSRAPAPSRGPAVVFRGCIMDGLFDHVHAATTRVLTALGYEVLAWHDQGCCGALHAHAGVRDDARRLAARNTRGFAALPSETVIAVDSAGCGAALKEYGHLLGEEAGPFTDRVRDVSEIVADTGLPAPRPVRLRVAYDAPCHLHHAQRVVDQPLQMLHGIPELDLVSHEEADACCGSAGLYSLLERDLSRRVLDRKIAHLLAAAPDVIATGNPGCAMHIGAGLLAAGSRIPVVHPIELVDLALTSGGETTRLTR